MKPFSRKDARNLCEQRELKECSKNHDRISILLYHKLMEMFAARVGMVEVVLQCD